VYAVTSVGAARTAGCARAWRRSECTSSGGVSGSCSAVRRSPFAHRVALSVCHNSRGVIAVGVGVVRTPRGGDGGCHLRQRRLRRMRRLRNAKRAAKRCATTTSHLTLCRTLPLAMQLQVRRPAHESQAAGWQQVDRRLARPTADPTYRAEIKIYYKRNAVPLSRGVAKMSSGGAEHTGCVRRTSEVDFKV